MAAQPAKVERRSIVDSATSTFGNRIADSSHVYRSFTYSAAGDVLDRSAATASTPPPIAVVAAPTKPVIGEIVSGRLVAPTKIPDRVRMLKEDEAPPAAGDFGVIGGVTGGVPGGQLGGVLGGIIGSAPAHSSVVMAAAPPKRVRISQGVSAGMLINQIVPEYPKIAKIGRIQGTVRLNAWITKDGSIERLTVVSGNPLLVNAAIEAVKQWRYKPFLLSGQPVEVETSVEVNFYLDQAGS